MSGGVSRVCGIEVEIEAEPLALPDPRIPVALGPLAVPGGLGAHKWCDRRLLAQRDDGTSVALIVDRDEELLEAAWANVWIVEGRRIVTPPADGRLLAGVTRALLLGVAADLGLSAAVETVSLDRARRADAIFLTSSLRHAVGATLDDRHAGAGPNEAGPLVTMIRDALSRC